MELKPIVLRLAILTLAFSVVVLAAAARHSQFLPQSDPSHFLYNAAKMNVGHSPDLVVPVVPRLILDVIPAMVEFRFIAVVPSESLATSQIARTLCRQHRSPPFSLG